ncbi:MAG TPA: DUF255 domain-containing protein [Candidatus Binataceae bacterium]|nr:DUF255 domain-containing protein [Candidatus Binataceae bacterium]
MTALSASVTRAAAQSSGADALPAGALRNAPSLYLREASLSPIRWQQWSDATLALARRLNRPLLIDIGAVWCHWCHVMDQGTYDDPRVFALVNRDFVPVKVDSDARPDVDAYFQTAAQEFSAGGWPLTCFATPAGEPLFIAGYLPVEASTADPRALSMLTLLPRVSDAYASDPEMTKFAHELAARLASAPRPEQRAGGATLATLRATILAMLAESYDRETGGFGGESGPRFYDFPAIELALAHGFFGYPDYTAMALDTLRKIAAGGVFDQLGGGLHRYSTDPRWRVPHFEKLLGDQALGLMSYADAYAESGDPEFAAAARAVAGYVNTTLLDPAQHFFYAHQDADAFPGDDGSYYTWTADEIRRACPDRKTAAAALLYFGVEDSPALAPDGRVVLRRAVSTDQLAQRLKISKPQATERIARASAAMFAARERRRQPAVDHALLTDQNALMASAFLDAGARLGDQSLTKLALDDLDFILAHLRAPGGGFYHLWSDGQAAVPGLAADQVYLLNALLAAYQSSGDPKYLAESSTLAGTIEAHYRDSDRGLIQNQRSSGSVIGESLGGPAVLYDSPLPSPQAEAAAGFATLAGLTSQPTFAATASQLLAPTPAFADTADAPSLGALGLALEISAHGDAVIAIAGDPHDPRAEKLRSAALAAYRPGKIVERVDARSVEQGGVPAPIIAMYQAAHQHDKPLAFVCAGSACARPTSDPATLAQTIREFATERPASGAKLSAGGADSKTTARTFP